MRADPIGSMIEALGLEIEAVRGKGGGKSFDLRGGILVGTVAGEALYRFPVNEDLHLRDETPVVLETDRNQIRGTLVSLHEGFLTVSLERELGPRVAAARLIVDDAFLIERLRDALQQVADGSKKFNRESAGRVIGCNQVRSAEESLPSGVSPGDLNSEQYRAVRLSLAVTPYSCGDLREPARQKPSRG